MFVLRKMLKVFRLVLFFDNVIVVGCEKEFMVKFV